jgi:hypothetical protein
VVDEYARFHAWDDDAAFLDEQIRAAGCFSLVDLEESKILVWPREKLPKILWFQVRMNDGKLGIQLCHDLVREAGWHGDGDGDETA